MILVRGGVTAPLGFLASGVKAGIKQSGRPDLALIYSEAPAVAAAAFTTNNFKASPVVLSAKHILNAIHQAIIVNAGNANCANGPTGDRNALSMASLMAAKLHIGIKQVLVASTGIIGRPLPVDKIRKAAPSLIMSLGRDGGSAFAGAIMTTDTVSKECSVRIKIGSSVVTVGGCCKGVGMIHPEIKTAAHATMLAFITTDAAISKRMLARALSQAVDDSFNMVSVDGDMSTNDTCFVLANAMAGNRMISSEGAAYEAFLEALKFVASELAKMMARDGEGATKFVEVKVTGAKTKADAARIARKVSTSNLLKCAIFGSDPNWGRIAASAGAAGVKFDPARADIYLGPMKVFANGSSMKSFDKKKAREFVDTKDVSIRIDLKSGKASAKAWTCDFSKEYVAINSEYST
jgi:glutamate N-acetyltransferase/amino-acid N-acetyltransferase